MEFTTRFELQSQTTRLQHARSQARADGSLTLSAALFQGTWPEPDNANRPQFGAQRGTDSHVELLPLQSPLLGESWLVSFPPLNYMLKFSGYSYLI